MQAVRESNAAVVGVMSVRRRAFSRASLPAMFSHFLSMVLKRFASAVSCSNAAACLAFVCLLDVPFRHFSPCGFFSKQELSTNALHLPASKHLSGSYETCKEYCSLGVTRNILIRLCLQCKLRPAVFFFRYSYTELW